MKNEYKINIYPLDESLIDERISIKLSGFNAKEKVTIYTESTEYYSINKPCHQKAIYKSYAIFKADDNGNIDLNEQAPIEGSYNGINPMGIIEFMNAEDIIYEDKPIRLNDVELDKDYKINFTVKVNDEIVASKEHIRRFRDKNVKCIDLNKGSLIARYFTIDDSIPKPGIIVVSGSEGGIEKAQIIAGLLASHGYSALSVCYFGLENLPSSLEKIPLEYIENALKWMEGEQTVISDKIFIYGRSKGGELALLAASMFKQIKGVIANTPSNIVWQGLGKNDKPSKFSSWTYNGKEIPYLKFSIFAAIKFIIKKKLGKPAQLSDISIESLNAANANQASIAVEKINGPILLISGDEDEFWPSKIFCENAIKRLKSYGFKNEIKHCSYSGSGHFMNIPYQGLRGDQRNAVASTKANEDSWNKTMKFLDENLKRVHECL